jgi:hypothetical protein
MCQMRSLPCHTKKARFFTILPQYQDFFTMITVNVIETEYTPVGDMAELLLDRHVEPALGMMLIDEKGDTWEVTGTLSDGQRNTTDSSMRRWTFQVKPVNTDDNIHTGLFKLMH